MWAIFRARRAWVALTLFSALWATAGVQASDQPVDKKPGQLSLEQQRETYIEAQRALSQRQMKRYRALAAELQEDRKSTRLNSSHVAISYAVFCLKKKKI